MSDDLPWQFFVEPLVRRMAKDALEQPLSYNFLK